MCWYCGETYILHLYSPSLFIYHTWNDFDGADPSSMKDTYELCEMTLFSMSSHSSVNRVPTWCLGAHGFDSCWELFFVPRLCHVDQFISLLSLKFTIFIPLSYFISNNSLILFLF